MSDENRLGITKGTAVEERVEKNFLGETGEVGQYLAMARQAEENGYPEIAVALKTIAGEEAVHASRFAELNGKIAGNVKENLERMLKGELNANAKKAEAGQLAKEAGIECAYAFFQESSRDEKRHANILQGLLDRFFAG